MDSEGLRLCHHGQLSQVQGELQIRPVCAACTVITCLLGAFAPQGLRHWVEFSEIRYGNAELGWPPKRDDLVAWSNLFRCIGTFSNYLGYVRTACIAMDMPCPPAGDEALRRAKGAIVKRQLFTPRCVCQYAAWRGLLGGYVLAGPSTSSSALTCTTSCCLPKRVVAVVASPCSVWQHIPSYCASPPKRCPCSGVAPVESATKGSPS